MVVVSTAMVYTAGQKIGFRKIMENQMQAQPKAQERLERLPADQRERQLEQGAKVTQIISYVFPAITLIIWLIIATCSVCYLQVCRRRRRFVQSLAGHRGVCRSSPHA